MDRVLLTLGGLLIAAAVALLTSRRRPDPPDGHGHQLPRQLDRSDFSRPDAPWLVAVFTSSTCQACAAVMERARHLDSESVAVQAITHEDDRSIHDRYSIAAVPTLLIADDEGVVHRWFLGPMSATDLWAAVAEVREPGTVTPECNAGSDPATPPDETQRS